MSLPSMDAVLAFLASLGDTAEAVAESLRRREARGSHNPRRCPVAVALRQGFPELNDTDDWAVIGHVVRLGDVERETPHAIRSFVWDFDTDQKFHDLKQY